MFEGEREGPEKVATHLIGKAIEKVFDARFPNFFDGTGDGPSPYEELSGWAKSGGSVVLEDVADEASVLKELHAVPGLPALLDEFLKELEPGGRLFGAELALEGLHQHSVLAKDVVAGSATFSDMVSSMWEDFEDPKSRRP